MTKIKHSNKKMGYVVSKIITTIEINRIYGSTLSVPMTVNVAGNDGLLGLLYVFKNKADAVKFADGNEDLVYGLETIRSQNIKGLVHDLQRVK
jgi:hypothetical protein